MVKTVRDRFASYHPVINFTFFLVALVCGMILLHPAFLAVALLLSILYYLTVKGRRGWKLVLGMIPLLMVLSLINPLFNTYGDHVLFSYFGGRPYTLEALCYGAALGTMMVSVLMWFACYNAVMTSDKFLFLFGKLAPSVTLILTMVLRLVPSYQKKVAQMNGARRCIGKGTDTGTKKEKVDHGITLLSALTSWALEGSVVTADSMRSRGYGCGKRTTFSLYRFESRDKLLLAVMVALAVIIMICCGRGAASVTYTPQLQIKELQDPYTKVGLVAYGLFLAIPSGINILEELRWLNLRSGI